MSSVVCGKASNFLSNKLINLILKYRDEACRNPTALTEKVIGEMRSSMLFPRQVREALEQNRAILDQSLQELSTNESFIETCAMMKDPERSAEFEGELRNLIESKIKLLISKIPICAGMNMGSPGATNNTSFTPLPAMGGKRKNRKNRTRQNRNRKNRNRKNRGITKRR